MQLWGKARMLIFGQENKVGVEQENTNIDAFLDSVFHFVTENYQELQELSPKKHAEFHRLIKVNIRLVQCNKEFHRLIIEHGFNERGSHFFQGGAGPLDKLKAALGEMVHPASHRTTMRAASNLMSFCPDILFRHFSSSNADPFEVTTFSTPLQVACILADISGFTKLSCSFCNNGSVGLDMLHATVNGFLSKFVQIVYSYGGDGIYYYCIFYCPLMCVLVCSDIFCGRCVVVYI